MRREKSESYRASIARSNGGQHGCGGGGKCSAWNTAGQGLRDVPLGSTKPRSGLEVRANKNSRMRWLLRLGTLAEG